MRLPFVYLLNAQLYAMLGSLIVFALIALCSQPIRAQERLEVPSIDAIARSPMLTHS